MHGQWRRFSPLHWHRVERRLFSGWAFYEVLAMTEPTSNALDWVAGSDAPEINSLD
ncbi:hypothetical protein GIV51_18295, partial [Pseudomonas syringae]|nr:hypothetical protein [Pseudomonas syringae]